MTQAKPDAPPLGRDPDAARSDTDEAEVEKACYFVIRLGESLYAFEERSVAFVAAFEQPVRVPTAADHFQGVVHLRGRIVAVADLARVLALPPIREDKSSDELLDRRLIVLESENRGFAVVADVILGRYEARADAVRIVDSDASFSQQARGVELVGGQIDHPEGIVTVLRVSALLQVLTGQDGSSVPMTGGAS